MTDLNDFSFTDGVDDVLAEYVNELVAGNLRGELTNTQTLSANLTLSDASLQIENLTPSGADRMVFLPPEANSNHLFFFRNVSGTYKLIIKDDSGSITFSTCLPGQTVAIVPISGTTWAILGGVNGREVLTAARTYYVRTDGSDSNTGLVDSAGGGFLTIQKAVDVAAALDLSVYDVTIQVKDGTYTGAVTLRSLVGSGKVIIQGNNGTPANVLISVTSNNCFTATGVFGIYSIRDMKLTTTTSGSGIYAVASYVESQGCNFGACAGTHVTSTNLSTVIFTGNYSITGNSPIHWQASGFGNITRSSAITITLTGTPAFSTAFAVAQIDSVITAASVTFSGSATGKRYDVTNNSVIYNPSSETFFPGNALGTRSSGGQYGTFVGETRVATQFDKANTTLADITGLSVSVLAGRTYRFRVVLYTTSNVASGVKSAISGTCTATSIIAQSAVFNAGALSEATRVTALNSALGAVTAVTTATIFIDGTITVNAAGTLTVQFADNAGTNTSSVLVGSTFEVVDIT